MFLGKKRMNIVTPCIMQCLWCSRKMFPLPFIMSVFIIGMATSFIQGPTPHSIPQFCCTEPTLKTTCFIFTIFQGVSSKNKHNLPIYILVHVQSNLRQRFVAFWLKIIDLLRHIPTLFQYFNVFEFDGVTSFEATQAWNFMDTLDYESNTQ